MRTDNNSGLEDAIKLVKNTDDMEGFGVGIIPRIYALKTPTAN